MPDVRDVNEILTCIYLQLFTLLVAILLTARQILFLLFGTQSSAVVEIFLILHGD
jgi:hypothetical protein